MRQEIKECDTCGHRNEVDAYLCSRCGHMLFDGAVFSEKVEEKDIIAEKSPNKTGYLLKNLWRRKILFGSVVVLLILMVLIPIIYPILFPKSLLDLSPDLGVVQAPNGANIGVNDGSYAPFDIGRPNRDLKMQAAQALKTGDLGTAISLWGQSLSGSDTNDAEVKIYMENQKASTFPHVTLIVGLDFPPPSQDTIAAANTLESQRVLQGAYIAQKEFNGQHGNLKLRLLLANTGSDLSHIPPVVKQIVQIAKKDPTVVGILGWPTSPSTLNVLNELQKEQATIPVLSEAAAADSLTNYSPHFFRAVPPSSTFAQAASAIAKTTLHATQAVVFEDPDSAYSQNIGQDVDLQFAGQGYQVISHVSFTAGKTSTAQFSGLLEEVLKSVSNSSRVVVFFAAAYTYDAEQFQGALGKYPTLQVITEAAGDVANKSIYGRWYVVSSSFHDEWETFFPTQAPFFQDYSKAFDPSNQYPGDYDYGIPSSAAISAYDGAEVLSYGIDLALPNLKGTAVLTPQDLENALSQIKGNQAWQGISGLIDFGADHDPVDKALIVLKVDEKGFFQMVCVQGRFSATSSGSLPQCSA